MKAKIIIPLLVILSTCSLKAQEAPSQHFRQAFEEISAMLEGKQPLDFEKAVFITENAYRDNSLNYEDFKSALNVHSAIIGQFIKANDKYDWKQFVRGNMGIAPDMEIEAKERYRMALANWAIFSYLTDTLTVKLEDQEFSHLPYTYSNDDPFGTADWRNSQTMNLLETQKGNCYSLVTLFKILSERFKSEANIVTAPQHIYIEHRDPKGSRFNVEVATRSFPDMGSIQTLTYTTREALLNDISMRKLDLKQSVGLNLVYLAKGYEYKNKVKDDEFILACANTTLQHDPKNLNALLLKAQVYEQRVMKKQMPSAPYEKMLAEFYKLGYRQMPDDMKEIILSKIQGRPSTVMPTDKTPNTFEGIGEQARVVTLSNGLFEEQHTVQKIVRYGQTIFDTEKSKIVEFLEEDISSYQVDPVVFALSVDPLSKSYPELTPYQFASNTPIQAIDLDGLEMFLVNGWDGLSYQTKDAKKANDLAKMKGYWNNNNPTFLKDVTQYFNENDVRYFDGSQGGASHGDVVSRQRSGRLTALRLIASGEVDFSKDIIVIGHSQGGAYASGMAEEFVRYIENHEAITGKKLNVNVNVLLLAPDGAEQFSIDSKANSLQFTYGDDGVVTDNKATVKNVDIDANPNRSENSPYLTKSVKKATSAHSGPIDNPGVLKNALNTDESKKLFNKSKKD